MDFSCTQPREGKEGISKVEGRVGALERRCAKIESQLAKAMTGLQELPKSCADLSAKTNSVESELTQIKNSFSVMEKQLRETNPQNRSALNVPDQPSLDDMRRKLDHMNSVLDGEQLVTRVRTLEETAQKELETRMLQLERESKSLRDKVETAPSNQNAAGHHVVQYAGLQAAVDNHRSDIDATRSSLESGMAALLMFKERTEYRLREFERMISVIESGKAPMDAVETLKQQITNKLKLQHIQAGLFTLRAFEIPIEERPRCIKEMERKEAAASAKTNLRSTTTAGTQLLDNCGPML